LLPLRQRATGKVAVCLVMFPCNAKSLTEPASRSQVMNKFM